LLIKKEANMLFLVKSIGVAIIILSALLAANPQKATAMISFFEKDKRLYAAAVIRIITGIIFLFSAPQCKLPGLMAGLGLFVILAGALIFVLGLEKTKKAIKWMLSKPVSVLRVLVLIPMVMGILIIYAA